MSFLDSVVGSLASPDKSLGTLDTKNPGPRAKRVTEAEIHTTRSAERAEKIDYATREAKVEHRNTAALMGEFNTERSEITAKWEIERRKYPHTPFPPELAEQQVTETERNARGSATATAANREARSNSATWAAHNEAIAAVVQAAKASAKPLKDHRVQMKGVTLASIASRRNELRTERATAESADRPIEEWDAEIEALVATLGKRPLLKRGRHGGLRIEPSRELVAFGHSITDALALIAYFEPDKLAADLHEQARAIVGDRPTMTAAARREALRKIDSELLALDYAEAELAWEAHASGKPLTFRKGMPAKCILGVE